MRVKNADVAAMGFAGCLWFVIVILLNLALIGAVVWVIVTVLKVMGVL